MNFEKCIISVLGSILLTAAIITVILSFSDCKDNDGSLIFYGDRVQVVNNLFYNCQTGTVIKREAWTQDVWIRFDKGNAVVLIDNKDVRVIND